MLARTVDHTLSIVKIIAWIMAVLVVLFAWSSHEASPVAAAGPNSVAFPDTTGDVGRYTSMMLDEVGNPVVAYYDVTNGNLKVLHCGDAFCVSGNAIASPDTTGDVGSDYPSLTLDESGFPVVSYFDLTNGNLKVLHCGNANCTAGNSLTSPDTVGIVGPYSSIALDASGLPVVSYYDATNLDLKVLHCGNANCTAGNSITAPDTTGHVGVYTSLELDSSGFPVVSHHDVTNTSLKVVHCGNANCTAGNMITTPDTGGDVGYMNSIELDGSGFPVVSYRDNSGNDLKVVHCGNANCSAGNTITTPDSTGNVGEFTSLALDASGFPVVSYTSATAGNIKVLHCGNANCTLGNVITAVEISIVVFEHTSLALDQYGLPVVSYYDAGLDDLRVLHCGNANCTVGPGPSFTVNSTIDAVDATPGNGVCATGAAVCTLRAAIQEANAFAGNQGILVPGGTYTLTIAGTGEDAGATGDLDITSNLSIKGAGPGASIVHGGSIDRVFDIDTGGAATLSGLSIIGGTPPAGQGGAGISNNGTLTLTRIEMSDNAAIAGGGAIFQFMGDLTITDSAIYGNTSDSCCGAIENSSSDLTITNSTISGNATDGSAGGLDQVGASSTMVLNNVTIAENVAVADANASGNIGGLATSAGTVTIRNSILGRNIDNTGNRPNCGSGAITSAGYNLLGDNSNCSGFTSTTGDQIGTGANPIDPLVGGLRNNGGATKTHAISVTSPAIDNGNPASPGSGGNACEAADQTGQARPLDGDSDTVERCDVGAYERQGALEEPCTPPAGGVCEEYRFDVVLETSVDAMCPASGDLRSERGATENEDADGFDDADVEITYLDGYVECPGDFFLGSSIPNEGTIEELKNNQPGVLEFPATGTFTVCLTVASHPFGDLHNCPNSFLPENKDPLTFTCTIASLSEFSCDIVGTSIFYNDSDVSMATVEDVLSGDLLVDTDQDGCSDSAEQQTGTDSEDTGGKRNYLNFWDFFDTPDVNNERDRAIAGTDFFRVLARFGSSGSTIIDPLTAPPAAPGYHTAFDRGAASGDPWDLTAADGAVAGTDFFAILAQFGHDCN